MTDIDPTELTDEQLELVIGGQSRAQFESWRADTMNKLGLRSHEKRKYPCEWWYRYATGRNCAMSVLQK